MENNINKRKNFVTPENIRTAFVIGTVCIVGGVIISEIKKQSITTNINILPAVADNLEELLNH